MSNSSVDIAPLLRRLSNISSGGERMAKAIIQSSADKIVANAKRNAPGDLGKLRQSIGKDEINNGYGAQIFANAAYAAYVEFGTGVQVDVPAELQDVASQFRGSGVGNFEDFKKAIQEWMSRHGIDEKYAFVIMQSILTRGLKPRPYLYPAFVDERAKIPAKLETAIRRFLRQS